mgnify:CR=1 FL=1
MEIFNELKSKVTETAKSALKKSNEIVEITKLNFSIGEMQSQMDRLLKDIGKIIYDAYKEGDVFSEQITMKCVEIDEKAEEIAELKSKLQQLKNIKICPNCQKENDVDASYCSRCGYQIETEKEEDEEE